MLLSQIKDKEKRKQLKELLKKQITLIQKEIEIIDNIKRKKVKEIDFINDILQNRIPIESYLDYYKLRKAE
jgi:RNA polymerase-interacting CarD/CdnL/TRCF family regulator